MFTQINNLINWLDAVVWGLPLIILILFTGCLLTIRLGVLQIRHLSKALKFMIKNEDGGEGEVSSFGALCTALSATIGTGNIVGVATAVCATVFTALTPAHLIQHFQFLHILFTLPVLNL